MAEGVLGAVLARYMVLLGRKLLPPFGGRGSHLAGILVFDVLCFFHRWNTFGFIGIYSNAI
jgi:hypothetical protein